MTEEGQVRVLGTSFNVFVRETSLKVDCFSGKVGVTIQNQEQINELTKGMSITARDKQIIHRGTSNINSDSPDWRQGRSRFTNAAFIDVIRELERQFDVEVNMSSDLQTLKGYNGGFDHDDLKLSWLPRRDG